MDTHQTDDHGVLVELEALQAIYIHELEVLYCPETNVPKVVNITLHPSTADNANEQYVRLTLAIDISPNYPNEIPEISIRSPRGLSDKALESINKHLKEKAQQIKGSPMLFELIEIAKEHLTLGNTPSCVCTICLYGFSKDDMFTKTDCYHYFHSHCLYRFIDTSLNEQIVVQPSFKVEVPENKILCPVCREPFTYDLAALKAPPPIQSETAPEFQLDGKLIEMQTQMTKLFSHQKNRGGIIDLEEEKNKFLIEISSVQSNVEVDLHVNRPGFDNNVTGTKKKSKSSKKPKAQFSTDGNGGGGEDRVIKAKFEGVSKLKLEDASKLKLEGASKLKLEGASKLKPEGSSKPKSESVDKSIKKSEESQEKMKKTAAVKTTPFHSSQIEVDAVFSSEASGAPNRRNNSNRGRSSNRRRNNYKRTNDQEQASDETSQVRQFQNYKPFARRQENRYIDKSNFQQSFGNGEGYKEVQIDENISSQSQDDSVSRRRNYSNNRFRGGSGNQRTNYRRPHDKQFQSINSITLTNGSNVKNLNDQVIKCVKNEEVEDSSTKWVQPLVVTGPPKMAFSGGIPVSDHGKMNPNKPPPGFETKSRNGAAIVAMLPPAGFQTSKPPPGFTSSPTFSST